MDAASTELLTHLFRLQSARGCFSSPAPGRRCWHIQQGAGHQPEVKKRGFISGLSLWSLSRQTGARKGASGNKAQSWHWSDVSPGLLDRAVPFTAGSMGTGRTAPTQRLASSDLSLLSLSQEREGSKARSVGMLLLQACSMQRSRRGAPWCRLQNELRFTEACFASFQQCSELKCVLRSKS